MLVSSVVGFNFGTTQSPSQSVPKTQNQQSTQVKNHDNSCCKPKTHEHLPQAKQQNHKLSLLA